MGYFFFGMDTMSLLSEQKKDDVPDDYIHVMSLTEALSINLKTVEFIDRDETLLDWLRARDYKGATFDHNNAYT